MDSLLSRIRIVYRPLLIVLALLMPLGGLWYFMMSGYRSDLEFSGKERQGSYYLKPLVSLLRYVPESMTRGSGSGSTRDGGPSDAMVVGFLEELAKLEAEMGGDLQFTTEGLRLRQREGIMSAQLRQSWDSLASSRDRQAGESHSQKVEDYLNLVRQAITHVGDTSNLILDPDLDSYYLMDAALLSLPSSLHRAAQILEQGRAMVEGSASSATALAVMSAQLREADVDRTLGSLNTALTEDAQFYGVSPTLRSSLEQPMKDFQLAADDFLLEVKDFHQEGLSEVHWQELVRKGQGFKAASFALWTATDRELERLLTIRMDDIRSKRRQANGIILSLLVVAGGVFVAVSRSITRPLAALTRAAGVTATGDLTVTIPYHQRPDEVGDMARAMVQMNGNLRALLKDLTEGARTLGTASTELSSVATQTAGGARQASAKAASVSAAAEEMSVSAGSVAAGMEEATTNLTTVAGATEELTSTISEIATHSEKARVITHDATRQAGRVTELVRQLSDSAQDIGKVTETITGISDQTKLLALNATIEAARAGAAGKGFAVVANEIKELARQTSEATEDIKAKIGAIQSSTNGTLGDIEGISSVIREMSEIVNTIATAIEEQSSVVKDVARNVGEAAAGVRDANERVAQMATVSQSVAGDIASVNQASEEMASGSERALSSATELSRLAGQLQQLVGQFRTSDGDAPVIRKGVEVPSQGGISPKGSRFMEWNDAWSVGVPAMDAHHRKLVDLINDLHEAMRSGKGRLAVGPALEELARYVEYHFSAEEKLMRQHRCEGLAEQQVAHAELIEKVKELRRDFAAGRHGLSTEVTTLLKDWLVNHIQKKDKACMSSVCEVAKARASASKQVKDSKRVVSKPGQGPKAGVPTSPRERRVLVHPGRNSRPGSSC